MKTQTQPNVYWLLGHAKYIAAIIFTGFFAGLVVGELFAAVGVLRGFGSTIAGTLQYTGIVTAVLYVLSLDRSRGSLRR
ncbi:MULTISPECIES: hypothetical protein [unclassified Haladaptatus]|uniref:hypothetical protein n=1 Tax=unclassified Haladaptatus TaxID=2622732 RepID=UPI0023E8CD98|nr:MULTISPECIES: hypothetical protein [unclassified Haladaptatus]